MQIDIPSTLSILVEFGRCKAITEGHMDKTISFSKFYFYELFYLGKFQPAADACCLLRKSMVGLLWYLPST